MRKVIQRGVPLAEVPVKHQKIHAEMEKLAKKYGFDETMMIYAFRLEDGLCAQAAGSKDDITQTLIHLTGEAIEVMR